MIKQQGDRDCFLCAAAMAVGWTYEQVIKELGTGFVEHIQTKGCYGDDWIKLFDAFGLSKDKDYFVLYILPEYCTHQFLRNILWGRRALCQVRSKNNAGEFHIVYWDGLELHDPSNKRTYVWQEVEPIYIWLFRESPKGN